MTQKLRFARWAAVSTERQAQADKVSLEVQLDGGAQAAARYGWQEVEGSPFVVPGESRTRWVNLRDAEQNIPALRQMLDAAKRGEFDLLYVYDLNRFRDLMRGVFDVLTDYGVQLYVASYPRDPVAPKDYTPERIQEASMIVDLAGMMSRNEVSSLKRHFQTKMPKRITEKGLHANLGRPPFGYRRPVGQEFNHDCILEPDPVTAPILLRIKDDFLAGKSMGTIARELTEEGVPSSYGKDHWFSYAIETILTNPFYMGTVRFGYRRVQRDRRTGTMQRVKHEPVTAEGKHVPMWDEVTYNRIVNELSTRKRAYPGKRIRPLSLLLTCETCGGTLYHGSASDPTLNNPNLKRHYWVCRTYKMDGAGRAVAHPLPGHAHIEEERAMDLFIVALLNALDHFDKLQVAPKNDPRPVLQAELTELTNRRRRWLDAFENGTMPADDAQDRIAGIDLRVRQIRKQLDDIAANLTADQQGRLRLKELAKVRKQLPDYIMNGDPAQVNSDLRAILQSVVVSKNKTIKVTLRA